MLMYFQDFKKLNSKRVDVDLDEESHISWAIQNKYAKMIL